jgi:hypothetical protein
VNERRAELGELALAAHEVREQRLAGAQRGPVDLLALREQLEGVDRVASLARDRGPRTIREVALRRAPRLGADVHPARRRDVLQVRGEVDARPSARTRAAPPLTSAFDARPCPFDAPPSGGSSWRSALYSRNPA